MNDRITKTKIKQHPQHNFAYKPTTNSNNNQFQADIGVDASTVLEAPKTKLIKPEACCLSETRNIPSQIKFL